MTVNYTENGIDLDYTYINANDVQYIPVEALNLDGKKVVMIGQNYQSSYPLGNVGSAFTSSYLNVPKIDQDNASLVAALPTAVIYQNKTYPGQTQIRGQFNLVENYPQTDYWINGLSYRFSPVQIGSLSNWNNVYAGFREMYAIKNDGTLWAWGTNVSNAINPVIGQISSPTQIGTLSNWSSVCAAEEYTLALQSNGTLWAMGANTNGMLGLGDTSARSSLTQVGTALWKQITSGVAGFVFGIQSNGTLWGWGSNQYGALGQNNTLTYSSPVQVGTDSNWSQVDAGNYHVGAIKTDGTLWMCGGAAWYQLGLSNTTSRSSFTQLGNSNGWSTINCSKENYTCATRSDGTLWNWGFSSSTVPTQPSSASTWASAKAGYDHTITLNSNGTLWGFRTNDYGQLGLNTTTASFTSPIQIGSDIIKSYAVTYKQTIFVKTDGTLWTCGYGRYGLQENGTLVYKLNYGL